MSLLSSFIRTQLLKAVEEEAQNYAPQVQARIIQEIREFGKECLDWSKKKMEGEENASD